MKKSLDLMRKKIQVLELKLKKKEELAKKYKKALEDSNLRIKKNFKKFGNEFIPCSGDS